MAKQLSTETATTPLCSGFFRCRVDVLLSRFSRSTISFAEFSVSTQKISAFFFDGEGLFWVGTLSRVIKVYQELYELPCIDLYYHV